MNRDEPGGLGRARLTPNVARAVREAIGSGKRALTAFDPTRLSSVDADGSLWRQLGDTAVARGLTSAAMVVEWAKLANPPAPDTRWSTLTPAEPVEFLRTEMSFASVEHYRAEDVLMRNSGADCITAESAWTWPGRQLLFDFTVSARPLTAEPAELAKCTLCWDTGNAGPDFSSRSLSFGGGTQREHVTITTPGATARLWHDGNFDFRFLRCEITVV